MVSRRSKVQSSKGKWRVGLALALRPGAPLRIQAVRVAISGSGSLGPGGILISPLWVMAARILLVLARTLSRSSKDRLAFSSWLLWQGRQRLATSSCGVWAVRVKAVRKRAWQYRFFRSCEKSRALDETARASNCKASVFIGGAVIQTASSACGRFFSQFLTVAAR